MPPDKITETAKNLKYANLKAQKLTRCQYRNSLETELYGTDW